MRSPLKFVIAALIALATAVPASAQQPIVFFRNVDAVSGAATIAGAAGGTTCALIKYRGTTAGKPEVAVAAGGDITLTIATVADVTTGSAANGIFDLSTPAAGVDTMGELVNLINTQGSNWVAVLVGCLASDLTDNAIFTLSAADASGPKGVALIKDSTVASATSIFSAQVALLPPGCDLDIRCFLGTGTGGGPQGANKPNANPFANYQTFIQNIREKITSGGTVALFEVLGVTRTYDGNGKVSDTVRPIWSETGAATTVEKAKDFNSGPLVGARGEMVIVRQRTATDLTVININGNGYSFRQN
jgi:hypothetical protein